MRMCDKCGKNPASIHFWESLNGKNNEGWLCGECAAKAGMNAENAPLLQPDAFDSGFDQLKDLLFGAGALSALFSLPSIGIIRPRISVQPQNGLALPIRPDAAKSKGCPTCGATLEEYSKGARNGCEDCAPVYNKALSNVKKSELDELNRKLKAALESENYEEAARLRDCIKQIGER